MRSILVGTVALALVAVLPGLYAVEKEYQQGVIVKVEQKARTRVLYYIVNTPITQDDPFYEVSIKFKDQIYIGEYTPRHGSTPRLRNGKRVPQSKPGSRNIICLSRDLAGLTGTWLL